MLHRSIENSLNQERAGFIRLLEAPQQGTGTGLEALISNQISQSNRLSSRGVMEDLTLCKSAILLTEQEVKHTV